MTVLNFMYNPGRGHGRLVSGIIVLLLVFSGCSGKETSVTIASGAGYKKPVQEISALFTEDTGIQVESIYGNMQTVSMQVKQSGLVGLLIGDRSFLANKKLGVEYSDYTHLGEGRLVLAYTPKVSLSGPEELLEDKVTRISMPDRTKAVYGKAAFEYLSGKGLLENLQDKIIPAATVPQVSSYLIADEVDAGFINLTDAIGIKDSIGGYILIDEGYSPIEIVAGRVKGYEKDSSVNAYIDFLQSDKAAEIFKKYGL